MKNIYKVCFSLCSLGYKYKWAIAFGHSHMGNANSVASEQHNRSNESEEEPTSPNSAVHLSNSTENSAANETLAIDPHNSTLAITADKIKVTLDAKDRKIYSLDLKSWNLNQVPKSILNYSHLNWVDLSKNQLVEIPSEICTLSNLKRLSLGNNLLRALPDDIGKLTQLNWIDLTHNRLTSLPDSFGDLTLLGGLGLSDCQISEFPICITRLTNLVKFGMFANRITKIPNEIGNLTKLMKLDFSSNHIQQIPKEIGKLKNLIWLNLSHNSIIEIPHEMRNLIQLKELGLGHNRIVRLPDLSSLRNLTVFPVYDNCLEEIGEWIGELREVEKIDVSFNFLKSFPPNVFNLQKLKHLNLSMNYISEISLPTNMNQQSGIEIIDVRSNKLLSLPWELVSHNFEDLKEIRVIGMASGSGAPRPPDEEFIVNELISIREERAKHCTPRLKDLSLNTLIATNGCSPIYARSTCIPKKLHNPSLNEQISCCSLCRVAFVHLPLFGIEWREPAQLGQSLNSLEIVLIPFIRKFCGFSCHKNWRRVIRNSPLLV